MARRTTEDRIENAAMSLFAQSGYKGTLTRKIAKEAGVSELTIYRCYKTKEELFRHALAKRMPDAWLDGVTMDHSLPLDQQLKTLFQRLHELLEERKELIRIFYRDGTDFPDIVELARQIPAKIWTPIEQYIRQVKPSETPGPSDLQRLFRGVLADGHIRQRPITVFHRRLSRQYGSDVHSINCVRWGIGDEFTVIWHPRDYNYRLNGLFVRHRKDWLGLCIPVVAGWDPVYAGGAPHGTICHSPSTPTYSGRLATDCNDWAVSDCGGHGLYFHKSKNHHRQ